MKNKQLLKILIGVAWIDGVIQPSCIIIRYKLHERVRQRTSAVPMPRQNDMTHFKS